MSTLRRQKPIPSAISNLPGIPSWAPDETLYSWCGRYHDSYGLSVKQTSNDLFGRAHAYLQHALPTGMDWFNAATCGMLGTPTEIVRTRTVAGVYWPFMDASAQARLAKSLASSSVSATGANGFGAARWSAKHDLRSCAQCVGRDLQQWGYARWQLAHQLPGVWVCVAHLRPLMTSASRPVAWKRPEAASAIEIDVGGGAVITDMLRLASLVSAASRLDNVSTTNLATACLGRMLEQGFTFGRSRRSDKALEAFFKASALGRWMDSSPQLQSPPTAHWISRLLQSRQASHPLQWLLLWSALSQQESPEQSVAGFLAAAQCVRDPAEVRQYPLWPVMHVPATRHARASEIREALDESASLRAAGLRLAMDPVELRQWIVQDPALASAWRRRMASERTRSAVEALHRCVIKNKGVSWQGIRKRCRSDVDWLEARAPVLLKSMLQRFGIGTVLQGELF